MPFVFQMKHSNCAEPQILPFHFYSVEVAETNLKTRLFLESETGKAPVRTDDNSIFSNL